MTKISAYCLVSGRNFSPALAQQRTGISLRDGREVGDIGSHGRYHNKPVNVGSATFDLPESSNKTASLLFGKYDLAHALAPHIVALRDCGADDFILHFDVTYIDQCNFELSSKDIAALATMGVDVTVTCYPVAPQDLAMDSDTRFSANTSSPQEN